MSRVEVYRGQQYRLVAVEPYVRRDGIARQLEVWESDCAKCGAVFTYKTTAFGHTNSPNRRCKEHRRPGSKVRNTAAKSPVLLQQSPGVIR
jgi:hypothetical protein